jgi:feruloyl esterase
VEVVRKITEGPKSPNGDHLWYGLLPSATYKVLAKTAIIDGKLTGAPFPIAEDFIKYLVLRDPDFDWTKMNYEDFAWVFAQSVTRLGWLIDTTDHDLSRFRDAGGKLLTYHGLVDEFIPVGGTIQYRQRVEDEMGGLEAVDEFYRLFLPAGVAHCGMPSSPGPVPDSSLNSLIAWVEEGKAPDFLHSSTIDHEGALVERDICRYPYAQQYTGKDPKSSEGWHCSGAVLAGLKSKDANLDSLYWDIPLPKELSPLKESKTATRSGRDEL